MTRPNMNYSTRDADFLREFSQFTSHGPELMAELLFKTLVDDLLHKKYESVCHLQARMHLEMVMAMETAAAHLYSYSLWNSTDGILGTLLTYKSHKLKLFVDMILKEPEPIRILKFPKQSSLLHLATDAEGLKSLYNETVIANGISQVCTMLRSEPITQSYNRIKHAGVYTRHTVFLNADVNKPETTNSFKILHQVDDRIVNDSIPATGQDAMNLAQKYFNNIKAIMGRTRNLADFVAYALDNKLMEV